MPRGRGYVQTMEQPCWVLQSETVLSERCTITPVSDLENSLVRQTQGDCNFCQENTLEGGALFGVFNLTTSLSRLLYTSEEHETYFKALEMLVMRSRRTTFQHYFRALFECPIATVLNIALSDEF